MNAANSPKSPAPQRSETEPKAALVAAPVTLFAALAILLYWGMLYLDKHAGGFNPQVYPPYDSYAAVKAVQPKSEGDEVFEKGKKVYALSCSPCHQTSGLGMAGMFPPLAGSEWVLTPKAGRAIRIVLHGAAGPMEVKGEQYNNAMVPWRDVLSDEDIAAVLTYVRNEWGNKAGPVSPDDVKKIRDATADRSASWTAQELLQIPEGE